MRWQMGRRSTNVEDRRGMSPMRRPVLFGGGGLMLLVAIAFILLGGDPSQILQLLGGAGGPGSVMVDEPAGAPLPEPGQDPAADFVAAVLGDTEDTWTQLFAGRGARYEPPRLVLFSGAVDSACGLTSSAVGPFYCPPDRRVYIDLSFYEDLRDRFGAPGDFAQAYVIAHEVGHHVQNLLGISEKVHELRAGLDEERANALSVRMELQADCLAGVWGHHAHTERRLLEEGDVEEGLAAAAAIGDDRIQKQSTGVVSPESWTHGSSAERARWLRRGLEQGRIEACDTFGG